MAYVLNAIIAKAAVLAPPPTWLTKNEVVKLAQGFRMVPVTEALSARLSPGDLAAVEVIVGFCCLTQSLWDKCVALSSRGTVAFVEDECFGGLCDKRCLVWHNGHVILGPQDDDSAVNKALRCLGVRRTPQRDEFDALGLGRHRWTEEWLTGGGD